LTLKILKVNNVTECSIIRRINRFVVKVKIGNNETLAYINNTGKLLNYLVYGKKAYCQKIMKLTKIGWRLIAISDADMAALVDVYLQMKAFENAVKSDLIPWLRNCHIVKRNPKLNSSVLDYLLRCDTILTYLEIKSAVLRGRRNVAMYPDCVSLRGRRHIKELINIVLKGGKGILLFIAAIPHAKAFKPNRAVDEKIYELIREATRVGVMVKAMGIFFNPYDSTVMLENPDLKVII